MEVSIPTPCSKDGKEAGVPQVFVQVSQTHNLSGLPVAVLNCPHSGEHIFIKARQNSYCTVCDHWPLSCCKMLECLILSSLHHVNRQLVTVTVHTNFSTPSPPFSRILSGRLNSVFTGFQTSCASARCPSLQPLTGPVPVHNCLFCTGELNTERGCRCSLEC